MFQNVQQTQSGFDNLEPEYISTFELNYIVSFSQQLTANISLFRNSLENLISRVHFFDNDGEYHSYSANSGKMITNGAEVSLTTKLASNSKVELSATYQKTKDKRSGFDNIDVAYSPDLLGYAKAFHNFDLGTSGKGTFSLTMTYVDDMESFFDNTPLDTENPAAGPKGRVGKNVDSYLLLGFNIRLYDLINKEGLYFNVRSSNILDKKFLYPAGTNNSWADKGTIGPGRSILFTVGWNF